MPRNRRYKFAKCQETHPRKLDHSVDDVVSLVHRNEINQNHHHEEQCWTIFNIIEKVENPSEFAKIVE